MTGLGTSKPFFFLPPSFLFRSVAKAFLTFNSKVNFCFPLDFLQEESKKGEEEQKTVSLPLTPLWLLLAVSSSQGHHLGCPGPCLVLIVFFLQFVVSSPFPPHLRLGFYLLLCPVFSQQTNHGLFLTNHTILSACWSVRV